MSVAHPSTNPFCTRFIRAGAIDFQFQGDQSLSLVHSRLRVNRWCGQIVGPHGSGKTTLLHALHAHWPSLQRSPVLHTLRNRQRWILGLRCGRWTPATQLIVDGFEQLHPLCKVMLLWQCRRRRCGLLVTTHVPWWLLPVVHQNKPSLDVTYKLVRQLAPDDPRLTCAAVRAAFEKCDGNVRETLLCLYDVCQRESATVVTPSSSPELERFAQE